MNRFETQKYASNQHAWKHHAVLMASPELGWIHANIRLLPCCMYFSWPRAKNDVDIAKCIEVNHFSFSMLAFQSSYDSASDRVTGFPAAAVLFGFIMRTKSSWVRISWRTLLLIILYLTLWDSEFLCFDLGKCKNWPWYYLCYTTIWIIRCIWVLSYPPKPYILQEILFQWICCICLSW